MKLRENAEVVRFTYHLDRLVVHKRVEESDGVGAAANARGDDVRQLARHLEELGAGFLANHRLQVPHQHWERVRTCLLLLLLLLSLSLFVNLSRFAPKCGQFFCTPCTSGNIFVRILPGENIK